MRRAARFAVVVISFLLVVDPLSACSTFCLTSGDAIVFGRNYDFETGVGMVVVNKRGVAKTSSLTGDRAARWTSKYGSVTFNQFGREFPMGGMNEEGLVVELMWLDGTVYPPMDDRPAVGLLEWIQYQLDNSATIDELIANNALVRIRGRVPLHFLVSDASGKSATVEFLDGVPVVHRGADLPYAVLTNDRYDTSLQYLRGFRGFGGSRPVPATTSSLDRFVRAVSMVRSYAAGEGSPVDYAFSILASVAQPGWTRWSIVYDVANRKVHFRSDQSAAIKTISFDRLDFSCRTEVGVLDVHSSLSGEVSALLEPYSYEANLALITRADRETSFLRDTPQSDIEEDARHPDTTNCTLPARRRTVRR